MSFRAETPVGYEPRANGFMQHSVGEWLFAPANTWRDHRQRKQLQRERQASDLPDGVMFSDEHRDEIKARIKDQLSQMENCQRCHGNGKIGLGASCPKCNGTGKVEATHEYTVHDLYFEQGFFPTIARATWFENVTFSFIGFNAIWIAVETDYNDHDFILSAPIGFQVVEFVLCAFFMFEWFVRFASFRRKGDSCKDGWFVFDSILVTMMVAETLVMSILVTLGVFGSSGFLGDATLLRTARLLRLSRMARVGKLLKLVPELVIMIRGMMAAMRSMIMALVLLVIVQYVFAIAFVQLLKNTTVGTDHFPKVGDGMLTLFLHGTLLDDVADMMNNLVMGSAPATVAFILYILISAMVIMNLLIGVLCEIVTKVTAEEDEIRRVDAVHQKLRGVFESVDPNGDNLITKIEFQSILETKQAAQALVDVGVDPVNLVDYVDAIFSNDAGVNPRLTFDEFMDEVLSYRQANVATVKDVVDLRSRLKDIEAKVMMLLVDNGRGFRHGLQAQNQPPSRDTSSLSAASSPSSFLPNTKPGDSTSESSDRGVRVGVRKSTSSSPRRKSGSDTGTGLYHIPEEHMKADHNRPSWRRAK